MSVSSQPSTARTLATLLLAEPGTLSTDSAALSLRTALGPGVADGPHVREQARRALEAVAAEGLVTLDPEGLLLPTEAGRARLAELRETLAAAAERLAGRVRKAAAAHLGASAARTLADRVAELRRLLARLAEFPASGARAAALDAVFVLRVAELLPDAEPAEGDDPGAALDAVREAVEDIYTDAMWLRWAGGRDAPRHAGRANVKWYTVRSGVAACENALELRHGPVRLHLVRIDPRKYLLRAVDASTLPADERDLVSIVRRYGALEGTSGGDTLWAETDIEPPYVPEASVGLLVVDGEVRRPPLFNRGALLVDERGYVYIRRVGLRGATVSWEGGQAMVRRLDRPRQDPTEVVAFTAAFGPTTPPGCGRTVTVVEGAVTARGEDVVPIPLLGVVLALPRDPVADDLVASLPVGTRVTFGLPPHPGCGRIVEGIGGGPLLLEDGKLVLDAEVESLRPGIPPATLTTTANLARHLQPRLAWGITAENLLIAVSVDGRDPVSSVGETLEGVARLLRALGCVSAVAYAGEGKRLCIDGALVDQETPGELSGKARPAPVRPLATAWVAVPKKPLVPKVAPADGDAI